MRKFFSFILVLLLFTSVSSEVFAAADNSKLPSGISYSDIKIRIDGYVQEHKDTTAAVSVSVFTGDNVLMEEAYGYSDIEKKIKNDKDMVFEWGSCTKLLVWTSVMQLVEKGNIDLNQDIRTYLPDGFLKKLKFDTPITMLNLMNHNAGWQDTVTDLFIKNKKDIKELGDALQLIEPEQVNKPGTVLAYSNWGAALAGYIVERVSGESFDDYVHEHIFQPLGMKHTALNAELSDNQWVAAKRRTEKCYSAENKPLGTCQYYISLYPAGMAVGTIGDFIKFGQSFLITKGKKSPLFDKEETLDEMLSPTLFFADGKTSRNNHGFWTDQLGVSVLWHNGGTLGSSSWFAFDPKSGTGMIVLTNQSKESVYNCGILPLVFGKHRNISAAAPDKDISGIYVPARSCFKGFAKPYSLISAMRIVSKGEGRYSALGTNITAEYTGGDSYLIDMGGLKQFIVYASENKDGHIVLQMPGSDYIEVNGYSVILQYALLVLFILAALYAAFSLAVSFIRLIIHKKSQGITEKYSSIVNISVLAAAMSFAYVSLKLFPGAALLKEVLWSIKLNCVLALLPVIYIIILVTRWKRLNLTSREKVKLILTGIAGLIMTINLFFWQSYKFW